MEYKGLIYGAYCTVSKKWYIGQTIRDLDTRKNEHIYDSFDEKDEAYNYKFHRAIRKYGVENFVWFVIEDNISVPYHYENGEEVQDKSLLNEREIYWVAYYDSFNNGYNMTPGGNQNPVNGIPVLQYTLDGDFVAEYKNCSEAERLNNIKDRHLLTSLHCNGKSCAGYMWFKKTSDNYLMRIDPYNSNKGWNRKAVIQYTIDGIFVAEYTSITQAEKVLNINSGAIAMTLNKGNHYSNNFLWYIKTSDNYPKQIEPYQIKPQHKKRFVIQYTKEGIFVKQYNSLSEASQEMKITKSAISLCLTGKRPSAGGYGWAYAS